MLGRSTRHFITMALLVAITFICTGADIITPSSAGVPVIAIGANTFVYYMSRGNRLNDAGETYKAYKTYQMALPLAISKRDYVSVFGALAVTSLTLKLNVQADVYIQEILKIDPGNIWALNMARSIEDMKLNKEIRSEDSYLFYKDKLYDKDKAR